MKKGVTLIELLISISIMVILAAAAVPIYGNLQISSQMNENKALITQTIRLARQNSISRVNDSASGVKFFSDRLVLYQGSSYDVRSVAYDRVIPFDSGLSLTTSLVSNEVNFSRESGLPDNIGEVVLAHTIGDVETITINKFGIVAGE